MAMNRILDLVRGVGKGYTVVAGSFAPNGSSAIAATSNKGTGWSVARTSAGLYTLTFTNVGYELVTALTSLQLATKDDKLLQIGAYDAAAKTLLIRVWDISGGDVADVDANANNRVHFLCVFRSSSVTK
jgi:hypothetical protein